jgi:hypothetical protein
VAVRTTRICDVDPKHEDAEPIVFGASGEFFTADMCAADSAKLTAALEPFTKVAAPISARDALRGINGAADFDPQVVRAWATRNGKAVADKGRVPADIVAAWRAATNN